VAKARDEYFEKPAFTFRFAQTAVLFTTITLFWPCNGADFVMMGRYFARFDESPRRKLRAETVMLKNIGGRLKQSQELAALRPWRGKYQSEI